MRNFRRATSVPTCARFILLVCGLFSAPFFSHSEDKNEHPPAHTFSIVAIDKETGEMGVAVQSKIVSVGSIVPFGDGGVGVVATQSYANVRYGPMGLELLRIGLAPDQVIELMTEYDPQKEDRQVAVLDREGRVAAFTGTDCMEWAGQKTGEGYSVQGNLLAGPEVIDAMADAFETTEGLLGERLIAALRAGQKAGGDRRGKQSAALMIYRPGWGYGGLNDRARDIRVDDHENPIEELDRVYKVHQEMFSRPDRAVAPEPVPEKTPDAPETPAAGDESKSEDPPE